MLSLEFPVTEKFMLVNFGFVVLLLCIANWGMTLASAEHGHYKLEYPMQLPIKWYISVSTYDGWWYNGAKFPFLVEC